MKADDLVAALRTILSDDLAEDLVDAFVTMRRDVASGTLGRTAPGKFVETLVQVLQYLSRGSYDAKPNVDAFLRTADTVASGLDDGLRICASRIARSMYSLRSKRNIAHKGGIDPNEYDLRYLLAGAQWILAELLRDANGISMQDAGKLVDQVQAPVGGLVEDFGGRRIVHGDMTIKEEVLVLLHSHYPDDAPASEIVDSLDRRSAGSVRNSIRALWSEKLIEGTAKAGYRLTQRGLKASIAVIGKHVD